MGCEYTRRTWAEIDLDAIALNMRRIRAMTERSACVMSVVKADAYGHGAVQAAKTALENGASWLGVSMLEEALELRNAGISAPILILSDNEPEYAEAIVKNDIRQSVYSYEMARTLSEAAERLNTKAKIHLKIDTGMGRIGFTRKNAPAEAAKIASLKGIETEGIFTHFASADECTEDADEYTKMQYREFCETCRLIEEATGRRVPYRHAANSAAIIRFPDMHMDMVRAGIIMYGLWPSEEVRKMSAGTELVPAMTLRSAISYLKTVEEGCFISYGRTYRSDGRKLIATVPAGYADGYFRVLGNGASVCHEKTHMRARITGRVCMDQMMIDVTDAGKHGEVSVGDTVILFGKGEGVPDADEIASIAGTVNYEVICAVGRRVPRLYIKDGSIIETMNRLV